MLQAKAIKCGKGCKKCPHGYYIYAFWKEGGKTKSKYIGKAGDIKTLQKIEELAKQHPRVTDEYKKLMEGLKSKIEPDSLEHSTTV